MPGSGLIAVQDTPLSVDQVLAAVSDPGSGGVSLFVGVVRDEDADRSVSALSYSAHPSAEDELRRVAKDVAAMPGVRAVAVVHRVGDLVVGDLAIVAAVACAHRGEAFTACRALVDTVKHEVPIWKHQRFTDGTEEWVGAC
jgi:molybdopterin synthase catalytic subunit